MLPISRVVGSRSATMLLLPLSRSANKAQHHGSIGITQHAAGAATANVKHYRPLLPLRFQSTLSNGSEKLPYNFIEQANRFEALIASESDDIDEVGSGEVGTILALRRCELDTLIEALDADGGDGTASATASLLRTYLATNQFKSGKLIPLPKLDSNSVTSELAQWGGTDLDNSLCFLLCVDTDDIDTAGSSGLHNLSSSFHDILQQLPRTQSSDGDEVPTSYRIMCPGAFTHFDALSCLLGAYKFERYKSSNDAVNGTSVPPLIWPSKSTNNVDDMNYVKAATRASYLVRDLISTPAIDLGPSTLQTVSEDLAKCYCADISTVVGEDLLSYSGNVPNGYGCGMIYAVGGGAASDRQPRLIDLKWSPTTKGEDSIPSITLVGKGVTYDTGGLNLKPGASMLNMKKDMGGAAHVLGVASLLLELNMKANVRVLIPAVENSIGSSAYRPGDVITAVNGKTTEIGNTDAEGRLVLGDALAIASADNPDLIIDFATLTGAARVALGIEVPAFLTNCDDIAKDLLVAAATTADPVWGLPLWQPYEERMTTSSKVADLRNIPTDGGLGGAITAALYLKQFVGDGSKWVHFDIYGMQKTSGIGEAQGMRAVAQYIRSFVDRNNR